jgi:hypothetical protein
MPGMVDQKKPKVWLSVLFAVAGVLIAETAIWALVDISKMAYWQHVGLSLIVVASAAIGALVGRWI